MTLTELIEKFTRLTSPTIVDRLDLPSRPERLADVPQAFAQGATGHWLDAMLGGARPWAHQGAALAAIADGQNVVVATGTASGKSLVFQAACVRELIEGDGCALVIYPQKALGADQRARWEQAMVHANLPKALVAELHGDISMDMRLEAIHHARIILATPDAIHAWLMRQVASPQIQQFLAKLRLLVLDEAHVYEGIFGSNCAYFFRRLRAAQLRVLKQQGETWPPMQVIAATATIVEPAAHLHALTGCDFVEIGEAEDGASRQARSLLHIDGPDHGAAGEGMVADILAKLAPEMAPHAFIAFHDSRQGVERIAKQIDRDDVLPYRSGYEANDRARIEKALRAGTLRGVVATSALELGIDIPQFVIGLNLGIPQSKKAFRQRLGRVGRASVGLFGVIAPAHAFRQFGSSLSHFHDSSVEPSLLYLDNRFIQFAQARCLMDECEALDGKLQLPEGVDWPASFAPVFELAHPGALRPREFDRIAEIGADRPHINYPLRQICETDYALRDARAGAGERVGTIQLHQAIREAYPGATYLHLRQPKRVSGWRSSSYERSIRLENVTHAQPTTPILTKTVNVSTAASELIEGRIRSGASGFISELTLQVNEAVEGYRIGTTSMLYRELRKTNANMMRKQREFSTTGVVIRIDQPWFSGTAEGPLKTRQAVARALKQMLVRERSLAASDIDFADSHVALHQACGPRKTNDAIVLYDSIYGGLRLTESLFTHFKDFLERLVKAAGEAGSDAMVTMETAKRLLHWYRSLNQGNLPDPAQTDMTDPGDLLIYAPQSEVGIRMRGELVERTLIEPQLMPFQGTDLLMYRYESMPGVQAWIAHDQVEAVGQNWRRAIWTPATNAIREIA